ncbi:MAG: hypothetical protein V4525_01730 [Pseudomonadota bacterium]
MALFFEGRKKITDFNINFDDLKIHCEIYNKWSLIESATARCGGQVSLQFSITSGVSERDAQTIEKNGEIFAGIPGGILGLKANIKRISGHEINFNYSSTATRTYTTPAPQCGRYTINVYKLVKEYELTFYKFQYNFFKSDTWQQEGGVQIVQEDLPHHDMLPEVKEFDEICKCSQEKKPIVYNGQLCFDMGKVSFRASYSITPEGNTIVQIFDRFFRTHLALYEGQHHISFPMKIMPDYVKFLSDIQNEYAEAFVFKYVNSEESYYSEDNVKENTVEASYSSN